MSRFILAIDQGTTSTRALLFDAGLNVLAQAQEEFPQIYSAPGLVEHDPEVIWASVVSTLRKVTRGVDLSRIAAVGLTNQRETTVLWDRDTGKALHNAIVWQDRRAAPFCAALSAGGHDALIAARTGLLTDPYFSGPKLRWLLDHVPGARDLAQAGRLAFGTIDSFLIWRLTGGRVHATDATNASRTMLYDIGAGTWDGELCELLDIPVSLLPDVCDCTADFGQMIPDILGAPLPIRGVAGDQQAAAIGQACFRPGMAKATFGTGCFMLLNTGAQRVESRHRLISTVASRIDGQVSYALEGSIFMAGAVIQWLRDGPGLIAEAPEVEHLAMQAGTDHGLVMVPAFTGLGAPYWIPHCRGAIFGLNRGTGRAEMARAALESIGFQTRDLIEAMDADLAGTGTRISAMRVDGGASASDVAMQFLADMIDMPVDRPVNKEATVTGAAWLAGVQAGLCPDRETFAAGRHTDRTFAPQMPAQRRDGMYRGWQAAIQATLGYHVGLTGTPERQPGTTKPSAEAG